MKTLKISTLILFVFFAWSCDDLENLLSKEFTGTAPEIRFTTTASNAAANKSSMQKAAATDYVIYNTQVSTSFINDKIKELNLSDNVINTFEVTNVQLSIPEASYNVALTFLGASFYVDDKLIAQNNYTIIDAGTTTFNLNVVNKDVLSSIKDKDGFNVKIVTQKPVPNFVNVVLKYEYKCKVKLL